MIGNHQVTDTTHTKADIHQEKVFEEHFVTCLTREQGYVERTFATHYDVALALDTELLFQFLKSTQPDAWKTLEGHYSTASESEVLKRLEKALREQPTHVVLRDGLKLVPNIHFTLCYFKPASNLNPDLVRLFNANILSVMRQVKYSSKNNNAIDLVTFVNGIPVTPNFDTCSAKFADFGWSASMISIGWVFRQQKSCSYMQHL